MTNETKHTPGPWETGARITTVQIWHDSWNVPTCIADCDAKNAPESEDEKCANARLIAAAPELLEAAKDALLALENENILAPGKYQAARELLQAAIAKAEGRS